MALALETVVKQLTDSGIIAPGKLDSFVPPKASPKDGEELIRELYKKGLLTKFQAQQVAAGKVKALVLGEYTVVDRIGAGGMGQVFKALHRRMDRSVAIKTLPTATMKDAAAVARFEREVKAAARLRHPNIVAADDAGYANGVHFLVMEYVEGQDLSALVKKDGPFSVAKAVNYVLQAARGLEFAHGEGVIHRDIKPANLLLDKKGTVKILDMGLARLDHPGGDAATQAELTGTGAIMGTVDYMAPEQALSTKHADARSDIYSLGCTLYYLLAAKPTYDGDSLMAKLLAHSGQPIPALHEVPEQLQAIFWRMLAKKPEDRYQTMSEVVAALEQLTSGQQSSLSIQQSLGTSPDADAMTFLRDIPAGATHKPKPTKKVGKSASERGNGKKKLILGAVGAGVLGMLILAGIIFSLRTKDGTLIVEVDQPDVTVQVLDEKGEVQITRPGEKGTISISVDPGKHRLRVEKEGFEFFAQDFTMESGGKKEITAKLEPVPKPVAINNFALDFDGTSSYVVTPVRYDATYPLTIEAFVFCRLNSATNTVISDDYGGAWGFALDVLKSKCRMTMMGGGESTSTLESETFQFNKIVHLASTFDGSEIRLFVDGLLQGVKAAKTVRSTFPILIGGNPSGNPPNIIATAHFDGMIREVRLSKVARYTSNFEPARQFTPDADTIALYHFDEGTGETAHDSSGNGNDAKIIKAKWMTVDSSGRLLPGPLASTALPAKPITTFREPAFQQWVKATQALPAEQQIEAVSKKLVELNPGFDGKVTDFYRTSTPKIEQGVVTELGFKTDNVIDISPLRALDGLKRLFCSGTYITTGKVVDISPLKGMSLSTLNCGRNPIADLGSLVGMPLEVLYCESAFDDLSCLATLPLKELTCSFQPRLHTKVLQSIKTLTRINGKPVSKFWADLPGEEQLEAVVKQLRERNPKFRAWVHSNIVNGKVVEVTFFGFDVSDISPLRSLTELTLLGCAGDDNRRSPLADLSPLSGMPLTILICDRTQVDDLSPLKGMPLTNLMCDRTQVDDLSPLKGMPLMNLSCHSTPLSDLTPLRDCKSLKTLTVTRTKVTPASVAALQKALPNCKIEWDDPTKATPAPVGPPPPIAKAPFDAAQAKAHQAAWAKHLGTTVETVNSVGAKMVLIPPGEFLMGNTPEQERIALQIAMSDKVSDKSIELSRLPTEIPQRKVTITHPFLMGATEVTVRQFRQFSQATNHQASDGSKGLTWQAPSYELADEQPVTCIDWREAVQFCNWLSDEDRLPRAYVSDGQNSWTLSNAKSGYRLATEAQWEYACRSGTTTQYSFGDDPQQLGNYGWSNKNANKPQTVAQKLPNPFGLFDMHGNVWEICHDWFQADYYAQGDVTDPFGPATGTKRVNRSGNWRGYPVDCRSAARGPAPEQSRIPYLGFRIVRTLDAPAIMASVTPQPTGPAGSSGKLFMHDPAFQQWMKDVAAMPAEEQVKAVSKKLVELNPGFDGKVTGVDGKGTPKIENGVVISFGFNTDKVTDISPVRALVEVKSLNCNGKWPHYGRLADLSPLREMALTTLSCGSTQVSDLSPLQGMPMEWLSCYSTNVSSLSPLVGMPLKKLSCSNTRVSDLKPLKGLPLTELVLPGTLVSDLSPLFDCKSLNVLNVTQNKVTPAQVAALQKALPNCKIEWDDPAKPKTPEPDDSGTK